MAKPIKMKIPATALLEILFEMDLMKKKSVSRKTLGEKIARVLERHKNPLSKVVRNTNEEPDPYRRVFTLRETLIRETPPRKGSPVLLTRGGRPGRHKGGLREVKATLIKRTNGVLVECRLDEDDPKSANPGWSKAGDIGDWGESQIRPDPSRKAPPKEKPKAAPEGKPKIVPKEKPKAAPKEKPRKAEESKALVKPPGSPRKKPPMKKYLVTLEFPPSDNCCRGEVTWEEVEARSKREAETKARQAVIHRIKVKKVELLPTKARTA
jgi:hypothetical protein